MREANSQARPRTDDGPIQFNRASLWSQLLVDLLVGQERMPGGSWRRYYGDNLIVLRADRGHAATPPTVSRNVSGLAASDRE